MNEQGAGSGSVENIRMQDQDVIREFLVESHENLSRLDQELVELEKRPKDAALLASIFRCIHTIKGTCGFFGFSTLERITHQAESLLSQLRDGQRELTPALISLILETVDATRKVLASIESCGEEGPDGFEELAERLRVAAQLEASGRAAAAGEKKKKKKKKVAATGYRTVEPEMNRRDGRRLDPFNLGQRKHLTPPRFSKPQAAAPRQRRARDQDREIELVARAVGQNPPHGTRRSSPSGIVETAVPKCTSNAVVRQAIFPGDGGKSRVSGQSRQRQETRRPGAKAKKPSRKTFWAAASKAQ